MNCAAPIDFETLTDYWLGTIADAEEESVEAHLFACETCSKRLEEVVALADGVRNVARQGNLLRIVDDEFLKRAASDNLRIREYAPPRGGSVQCTVSAPDDLLIGRLAADLSSAKRLDLSLCSSDGNEFKRLDDIPFHSNAKSIAFQQPIEYAKASPSDVMVARLLATADTGEEELLGEYTFVHTRTIPGAGRLVVL